MRTRSLRLAVFCLLLITAPGVRADEPAVRTFAVRTTAGADDLAAALEGGGFQRWVVPSLESVRLVVGPEATGDVVVEARVLPAGDGLASRLAGLPVRLVDDAIVLGDTAYRDPRHALALRLPAAETPTWVVVGHRLEATAELVDQVLITASGVRWWRRRKDFDYLLREHAYCERSGLWHKTEHGFGVDPEGRDDLAERAAAYAALRPLRRRHTVLQVPPERAGEAAMGQLADALDAAARAMARRLPVGLEEPLEIVVEADYVAQGRHLAAIGEAVLAEDGRLHVVARPEDSGALRVGLGRALLRRAALELPPWLADGAALWLAGEWYGRPFAAWLPALACGRVLPSAAELLAGERQGDGSEVLWPPVAAAVVEGLPGDGLAGKLVRLPSEAVVGAVLRRLEAAAVESGCPVPERRAPPPAFLHGVSLAMANGLEVGYHAPGVDQQLTRLAALGADSVSLMPFAGQRQPDRPELAFYNDSPSSESDVGMIHAARRAHARGFSVLWKPQIWVSHDSWPGDIAMTSEDDWQAWWRSYRRFVLHHAVLAEWTGSELFSIGVELGRTLEHEADWRFLIDAVRRIYSGHLTYSGNWWGDYDRAPFWDRLDLIGVDAYFPLAGTADADPEALAQGARRAAAELAAAARRYRRPVLLTELGFAAREAAWVAPHEEGGTLSEDHQELAYRAFLDALGRPPWLTGIYVWKAFSHPSSEGGERPDFRFLGRGAEAVIEGYYRSAEPQRAQR